MIFFIFDSSSISKGNRLTPSNGSDWGKFILAIADKVGYISKEEMGTLLKFRPNRLHGKI